MSRLAKKRPKKRSKNLWIQHALKKRTKGALHRQLGIPEDETIPVSILRRAAKEPGLLGKRARFALNLRNLRKHK